MTEHGQGVADSETKTVAELAAKVEKDIASLERESSTRTIFYDDVRSKMATLSYHNEQLRTELSRCDELVEDLKEKIEQMRHVSSARDTHHI